MPSLPPSSWITTSRRASAAFPGGEVGGGSPPTSPPRAAAARARKAGTVGARASRDEDWRNARRENMVGSGSGQLGLWGRKGQDDDSAGGVRREGGLPAEAGEQPFQPPLGG